MSAFLESFRFLCSLAVYVNKIKQYRVNFPFLLFPNMSIKKRGECVSFGLQVWASNMLDYVIVITQRDAETNLLLDGR